MLLPLKLRVKQLYLDRGFYSVPVIRWLKALNIPFLIPAVIRGKTGGTRSLLVGRKSYRTRYTLSSNHCGPVTCQMRVVCTYYKGFKNKHGIQYALYVAHRVTIALHQLHQHYRERFGIETSYRIKNQCRIRTTSKNPVVRLLFVALAFILVNLWVYLLWFFVSQTQRGGRVIYRELFGLKTMLEFLSYAVERHFPPPQSIYLPQYNFVICWDWIHSDWSSRMILDFRFWILDWRFWKPGVDRREIFQINSLWFFLQKIHR